MIVTVTLNPTLDKTLSVPVLRPGEGHRTRVLGGATGRAMRDGLAALNGTLMTLMTLIRRRFTLMVLLCVSFVPRVSVNAASCLLFPAS